MLHLLRTLRRSGALFLGVLLLHTSWMASVSACARSTTLDVTHGEAVTAMLPHAAHAHHGAAPEAPADAPRPHHAPATATCPMAMACTMTAVAAAVPTVIATSLTLPTDVPSVSTRMPRTARIAPEPPPPRA
jgi:hypothetical protein